MTTIAIDDPRAVAAIKAIHDGDVDSLRKQLEENPDLAQVRIVDGRGVGRTLVHTVADWPGHFPNGPLTVAALAEAGADLDAPVEGAGYHREAALHGAASSNDVAVLDALLDHGADIEAPGAVFTGGSAMSDAVIFANWNAARRLLERGAKVTVWQSAALGLLENVVADSAELSREEITNCLWHACRCEQLEVAKYLLERGAEVNWIGWDKKTPLDVARESGHSEMVEWLEGRGARAAREL